ncbi:MAG: hypothetical protein E7322_09830 [Clostridiales bacterium]|nr:hypothetical protein [Clostridiales bacterium]
METIISAAITGGLALLGVIISNLMQGKKIEKKLEIAQAVTDVKLEELTREVREHNNFAKRMPQVEGDIKHIKEMMKLYHPHNGK